MDILNQALRQCLRAGAWVALMAYITVVLMGLQHGTYYATSQSAFARGLVVTSAGLYLMQWCARMRFRRYDGRRHLEWREPLPQGEFWFIAYGIIPLICGTPSTAMYQFAHNNLPAGLAVIGFNIYTLYHMARAARKFRVLPQPSARLLDP